ncbi:6-phosphofructokinase [Lacticaseibacillus thailandensis]|uniref:ATP-dependent 6-phosphofructokinase n=1 Tax=Lacticaseibacillus thailandensis DSM 22698 = JCM 13996 TaxID=1423810 RepID=A0A0R2CDG5_9LACO|nr:6-phosphofructokinase [Lacticaseibacillus thailandensis]KRM88036.1 6-phosphofructokinase [Lacticaseibacillus thailandensis DSM 22698 = JCM 13996]
MKRIGIMTSGGDAPGMNAAVRAVTRKAEHEGLEAYGINYGFAGLLAGDIFRIDSRTADDIINRGGTILYSARFPEFAQEPVQLKGVEQLKKFGIDAIVVIGGDGSYHGALRLNEHGFNAMGLPGTIDNDIPYTDFTIGFDSALNTAVHAMDNLRDTAASHERTFVVEVMGRNAGDIAMWAAVASAAEDVIIPEKDFDVAEVAAKLKSSRARGQKHAIIVLAEGVMTAAEFADKLKPYGDFQLRATTIGHVQRGGSPTAFDRVLASRMGSYAVELLMEGKGGLAIGIQNNKLVTHNMLDLFDAKHEPEMDVYKVAKELAF